MAAALLKTINRGVAREIAIALSIAVCALVSFGPTLLQLAKRWSEQEEYSHAFLIPIIAAYLLWMRRDALRATIGNPSWFGPIALLIAVAMHTAGALSNTLILSQLAFEIAIIGTLVAVGGFSFLKTAFFPVAFLLFAIPVPYFLDFNLSLQLQLVSTQLGVFIIKLFHIPVLRDGNIIDLGHYAIQVVQACSGLRYLYPLISLSFLAAYLFQAPLWQRAIVFISSIPITIAMNSIRIALVGITVDYWGAQAADALVHDFEGWVVFLACAGVVALEVLMFVRLSGVSFSESFYFPTISVEAAQKTLPRAARARGPILCSTTLLFAAAIMTCFVSGRVETQPSRLRFVEFPDQIKEWRGVAAVLEPDAERSLRVDDYILYDFRNSQEKSVNLYAAYYASQKNGAAPHSPRFCIPGSGWEITTFQLTSVRIGQATLPVNRVVIERRSHKQLVYYWFIEGGHTMANESAIKWQLLTDAIVMNRSDGALIRLTTQIASDEAEADADRRLIEFSKAALPALSRFLPSESPPVESAHAISAIGRS